MRCARRLNLDRIAGASRQPLGARHDAAAPLACTVRTGCGVPAVYRVYLE